MRKHNVLLSELLLNKTISNIYLMLVDERTIDVSSFQKPYVAKKRSNLKNLMGERSPSQFSYINSKGMVLSCGTFSTLML